MADGRPRMPQDGPLKLRAVDTEDLAVLAAFLQDAIVNVSEMAYLPDQRVFALAVCRFRWERVLSATPEDVFERVSCAITVNGVDIPKYRGFSLKDRSRAMPLLTILFEGDSLVLTFGGDAAVRLPVAALDVRIEDFGEGWPTTTMPEHESPPL